MVCGCSILPEMTRQPQLHNPFPQLCKVAVAPFFNLTSEPTLDGRKVAIAYFNELQLVPGFEVVPVGIVETTMRDHKIDLRGASEAHRLAQILKVDAIVIGAVTDYFPYYPPRIALQVEWYAANPGFHPIPPGYGLPWGTPEEKDIPATLIFEAEFALAKAQLKTQTPHDPATMTPESPKSEGVQPLQYSEPTKTDKAATDDKVVTNGSTHTSGTELPPNWPDARGFIPPPPRGEPPASIPTNAPVLRHTRTYNGNDADFTTALSSYYAFRDDARFGGWQSYLNRSDDFIRFCCHMHISEMLTARGGAGESRLVWRQQNIR
jgi:hypothetical protein